MLGQIGTAMGTFDSSRRLGGGHKPEYRAVDGTVVATIDGVDVGVARLGEPTVGSDGEEIRALRVQVKAGWQRRGIGTRLLIDACKLAHTYGTSEIVLTTRSDNRAILPMALASGLRARYRLSGDQLSVRVPVGQ